MADDYVDGVGDEFDPEQVEEYEAAASRDKDDFEAQQVQDKAALMTAYRRVFSDNAAMPGDIDRVMKDLCAFCRGHSTTFHPNDRVHALLDGRKEVYYRIMEHIGLDIDAMMIKVQKAINN